MTNQTRPRIAAAAMSLLEVDGPDAVTIRKVASKVGLSPMAIYRHYSDRDALLSSIAAERFAELEHRWNGTARTGPPVTLIRAALEELLDFAREQPHVYDWLFLDVRAQARRFPADFASAASPTFSLLTGLVRAAMGDGSMRPDDPEEVALMLTAVVHGLVQQQHSGRISLTDTQFRAVCRRSVERAFDGLAAPR
jgi:AcrR family transcriptional regulator